MEESTLLRIFFSQGTSRILFDKQQRIANKKRNSNQVEKI